MVRWCIRLTRLTLVYKVIRYRLVQVQQNKKKTVRVRGPQAPFFFSSSFILSFISLPFFLNTKMNFSEIESPCDLVRASLSETGPRRGVLVLQ